MKLSYIPLCIYLCEKNVSFRIVETFSCLFNLEWACVLSLFSRVWLCETLWTVACQAPQSVGFSRQVYWNGLPCPPPGDLPDPGIEPMSLTSPALAGGFFTTSATWAAPVVHTYLLIYIHTYVRPVLYMCVRMHARVCSIASSHRFLRPPGVHTCASYTGSSWAKTWLRWAEN